MNRTLRIYFRWTLVLAILITLVWIVYFLAKGSLPSVSREIAVEDWKTTLPFALPHYLDFLAAPIIVGTGLVVYKISHQEPESTGIRALISAVGVLSPILGLTIALPICFHAGVTTATLASIPLALAITLVLMVLAAGVFLSFSVASFVGDEVGSRLEKPWQLVKVKLESTKPPRWLRWLRGD